MIGEIANDYGRERTELGKGRLTNGDRKNGFHQRERERSKTERCKCASELGTVGEHRSKRIYHELDGENLESMKRFQKLSQMMWISSKNVKSLKIEGRA